MSLGQRLYDLRKTTGLSQEKAAEQLGVTRKTVSKWETDQTTPDFDKIIPICNLYNVTTAELFGEEKENDYSYNIDSNTEQTAGDSFSEAEKFKIRHKYKIRFAVRLSIGICLYILSVTPFVVLKNEKLSIVLFFVMIAVATMLIVFGAIAKPKFEDEKKSDTPESNLYKRICSIMSGVVLVIYLLLSFLTGAWYITWVLWIVYAIACQIAKLVFSLKGIEIDE